MENREFEFRYCYYKSIAKDLHDIFNPNLILDVGCSAGDLVKAFRSYDIETYGCDISVESINGATDDLKKYLIEVNVEKDILPFKDEQFDLITLIDVIEHFNTFEQPLIEMKRVLKKDGIIYISTPSFITCFIPKYRDPTHVNVHNSNFWIKLFEMYGFNFVGEFPVKSRKKAISNLYNSNMMKSIVTKFPTFRSNLFFRK